MNLIIKRKFDGELHMNPAFPGSMRAGEGRERVYFGLSLVSMSTKDLGSRTL